MAPGLVAAAVSAAAAYNNIILTRYRPCLRPGRLPAPGLLVIGSVVQQQNNEHRPIIINR